MSDGEIEALVVGVLREVQTTSGMEWTDLRPGDKPIGALDGFDSLMGLEATVLIEEQLRNATGRESLGDDSLFVEKDRALSLREVCQRVKTLLTEQA